MRRHLLAATALALVLATPALAQSVQTWQYANINTTATTTLKTTPGVLHSVCVNTPVATGTIQIYDNTAGSGNKIGLITIPSSPQPHCQIYDVAFWTGLTIVTATAAQDITVSFR
jgi:hypothetical protein